jgi:serine/threonine-protein kinase
VVGATGLVVVAVASGRSGSGPVGVAEDGGIAAVGAPSAQDAKTNAVVSSAQATIDRGDFATAIDELAVVEKQSPARADVHLLLERAYSGVRNTREVLHEAGLWLATDPRGGADLKLQEDVRNAALVSSTQDEAFALLESRMGVRGIDILYDVAFGTSGKLYAQAAARAKRSLELADVRGRASPALAILLDFRDAKACDDKHALLERARDHGDARLLSVMQPFESTRGCGFLGRSDCYPCMRKDRLFGEAKSAIEERATRSTQ